MENGDSIKGLAYAWGYKTSVELSRVIHRRGRYLYPELIKKLARYLKVHPSQIGRAPAAKKTRPTSKRLSIVAPPPKRAAQQTAAASQL